jgi:hypothetical protein
MPSDMYGVSWPLVPHPRPRPVAQSRSIVCRLRYRLLLTSITASAAAELALKAQLSGVEFLRPCMGDGGLSHGTAMRSWINELGCCGGRTI